MKNINADVDDRPMTRDQLLAMRGSGIECENDEIEGGPRSPEASHRPER